MAHTVTVAAIKSAMDEAIDDVVITTCGTPLRAELEMACARVIDTLVKDGLIKQSERVEDV